MFRFSILLLSSVTKNDKNTIRRGLFGIIVLSVLLVGCSAVKKGMEAYQICANDPACVQQAEQFGQLTQYATTQTLEDTPDMAGIAGLVGISVGGVSMIVWKLIAGLKTQARLKNVKTVKK